ncbi:MAG: LLM class flavin-dependent oxidoreductase [Myxococcales bacterium]|nr:LLM class flavin-dependent oxidoreductase [Myxococcales bacterium]
MATIEFGLFDWIDLARGSVGDLYESRLQLIEFADRAGFYGYHLAEHHGTPLGMAPSPSLFFAALAQRTRRIRFGPMAFLLPMYHPVRLIEEVCMLDHLSGGRVEIGVSRGVSPYEIACFGVDPNVDVTREIFSETLDVFRAGMSNEVLDYSGKYFEFRDVPMEMKPVQRPYPPLWYPSFSESGVTYAAEHGFNFMSLGPPALIAHLMDIYRKVSEASTRRADRINGHVATPKLGAMRQIFVAETEEKAFEIARPAYEDWYKSITKLWHRNSDASYDDFFRWDPCLAAETILVGSVDKVREQIQRVVSESGINYFVGSFAWGSLPPEESRRSLELFASEIMPEMSR